MQRHLNWYFMNPKHVTSKNGVSHGKRCYGHQKCLALLVTSSYSFGFTFYRFNYKYTQLVFTDSFKKVNTTPRDKRQGHIFSIVPSITKQSQEGSRVQFSRQANPEPCAVRRTPSLWHLPTALHRTALSTFD